MFYRKCLASLTQIGSGACHLVASDLEKATSKRGTCFFRAKTLIRGDGWRASIFTGFILKYYKQVAVLG